jgi:hypothetical protein
MIILTLVAFVPRSYELVIRVGFRGSMVFCIEKPCAFLDILLSLEIGIYHSYGLV